MTYDTRIIRSLIREMLNEIDIEEIGQTCWAPGSTHDLKTCTVGNDKYYLKFSDPNLFGADDPSLQILNEYLAYRIFRLFPGINIPERVEPVYDRVVKRVGLMTTPAAGSSGRNISRKQLAKLCLLASMRLSFLRIGTSLTPPTLLSHKTQIAQR